VRRFQPRRGTRDHDSRARGHCVVGSHLVRATGRRRPRYRGGQSASLPAGVPGIGPGDAGRVRHLPSAAGNWMKPMISLSTGAFFERATRQIGSLRERANDLQNQIGSGERLSRSSDDPVVAARLRTLARRERLSEIDQRNSDRATTDLRMTDRALGGMADLIIRAKELAMQAASESMGPEQRKLLGAEIAGVRESLLMIANSRDSGGRALFGGQAPGLAYDASGTYVGTGTAETVEIGEGQTV